MRILAQLSVTALAVAAASSVYAQTPAGNSAALPSVGSLAPDFTIRGATREGVQSPSRLSDLRGKTVVIAFFPKARTRGCTVQMETYRDKYASIFNEGDKVVVLPVSVDADTTLVAWARESNFPFLFASDVDQAIGKAYSSTRGAVEARNLFVVGPDGRIAHAVANFNVLSQDAYTALETAVDQVSGGGGAR